MFKDFNLLSQSPVLPFETRSSRTHIHITGFAGLVKLGTVRNDVAAYWEKQDVEAFGAHIFEKELSVDQALVSYHLAKKEKEAFAVWSGTFPSLAIWLPRSE